ncbi:MAG: hypothetical protein Kow00120_03330 [Anaerolineae bacterium]
MADPSVDAIRFLTSENARLKAENRELHELLADLREFVMTLLDLAAVADRFTPDGNLLTLLDNILYNTLSVLRAKDGSIMLLDTETDELVFTVVHGDMRGALVGYRIPVDTGIAGWCVQFRQSCIVNDVRVDPRFSPLVDQMFTFRTDSVVAAPLIGDGRVLGAIEVLNKRTDERFDELDQALLELLSRFAGEALAQIEAMPFPEADSFEARSLPDDPNAHA